MKINAPLLSLRILTSVLFASVPAALSFRNVAEAGPSREIASEARSRPVGLNPSDWSGIREAHEVWRHRFFSPENGKDYLAANPGQQWVTEFDGRGFTTRPDQGGWDWGLQLVGYGVGEERICLAGASEVIATPSRLTYKWDSVVEEWFVNDRRGLEQGWTLAKRPDGSREGRLSLDLTVRSSLRPLIDGNGRSVRFVDANNSALLVYGGLRAWDADGRDLDVRFVPLAEGLRVEVDEGTARYPITIDPVAQQAYLKASNVGPDYFGTSVAIDGDTVVVGAYCEESNATGVNQNEGDNSMSCAGAARDATGGAPS